MIKKKIIRSIRISRYVMYKETLLDFKEHFWAFTGSFMGIGIIAFVQHLFFSEHDNFFLIGSFGASSVLVYGVIQSPLAQPKNLVGGHINSAIVGVTVALFVPDILWITAPLAVSLSIVVMQMTKTLHPPGGATALIAVIGSQDLKELGYLYVLFPVLTGAIILLIIALIFNNITPNRRYPVRNKYVKRMSEESMIK